MKRTFLLKMMLLLCALVAGSSSVWAEDDVTITWNINGVATSANGAKVNTALTTSSITPSGASGTWTAVSDGNNSYAASSTGAQLGASSSRQFNGTVSLSNTSIPSSATIKSVSVSITANGTSTLSATVGGNSLGSNKSITNTTATYTIEGSQTGNNIVLTFSNTQSSKYIKITKIVVTYSATIVAVTGVSLPNTAKAFIGKKTTLTPIFTPSDATNKNVTWESKNTSIATVSDAGEVTGVAEGTVNIEVTTDDGGFTATCEVTVEQYQVDLTSPIAITSWPSLSYSSAADYEVGGIIFTATQCMNSSGLQFRKSEGILASPIITTSNGYTIIVTTNGAGTGTLTLQIGSETPVSISSGGNSSFSATTSSTSTSFTLTNSSSKACNIATLTIVPNQYETEVSSYGWASYIAPAAVEFEANTAYVVTNASISDGLTLAAVTQVPAGTPLLLKGAGDKTITVVASATAPTTNLLTVHDGTDFASDEYPYVLAKNGEGACFKQWTGEASVLNGRVVLILDEAIPDGSPVLSLDGETTTIETVKKSTVENGVYYNLSGQRVAQPTKGLYIVNGKKVIMK